MRQQQPRKFNSNRIVLKSLLIALSLLLLRGVSFPQDDPSELVQHMVQNELDAAKNDQSHWMYRDSDSEKGTTKVEEVIQIHEGWMRRLISVNDRPPSDGDRKKNEDEIQKFLNDPSYRQQQRRKLNQDGNKATDLLSMLPKAFLYQSQGREGQIIRLAFRPNPAFHPPTREAKVFHAMGGTLLIDSKSMRLVKLSGQLIENVDFGGGILGRLHKGGIFEVDQADVGRGHWEMTKLDVHISGRAIFFATIGQQQQEVMTGFREVPPDTTLPKAAEMLKGTTELASNK